MTLWTNIIFAWIALILTFLLVVIWALRLFCRKKKIKPLMAVNRWLRRHHKLIGLLLIGAGAVHGLLSSDALFSLNIGTVTWIISILLGLNWLLRKKMKKAWMAVHRLLTAAFAVLLVIHILNVGGFILDDMIAGRITPPADETQTEVASTEEEALPDDTHHKRERQGKSEDDDAVTEGEDTSSETQTTGTNETTVYIDGTYQGTGTGFSPGLVVEVVIEDGQIASVTVIDHNEQNERYWGYPVEAIPEAIVDAQSTDVDSISGATRTSEGIKEAVDDALSQALAE